RTAKSSIVREGCSNDGVDCRCRLWVCRKAFNPIQEVPMSLTLEELGLDRLSVVERLDLISTIWDSIPNTLEALPIPEWHRRELERRLADCETNPEASIPWEEVKARLRSQL